MHHKGREELKGLVGGLRWGWEGNGRCTTKGAESSKVWLGGYGDDGNFSECGDYLPNPTSAFFASFAVKISFFFSRSYDERAK